MRPKIIHMIKLKINNKTKQKLKIVQQIQKTQRINRKITRIRKKIVVARKVKLSYHKVYLESNP